MTTPAFASGAQGAALAAALVAIARHVTGHSDDADALRALGLSEQQAKLITGK
jgi:hypothetical protein